MRRFLSKQQLKRYGLPGIILIALLACMPWLIGDTSLPEGLIQVNGRLEGERITVSTEYAGRINKLEAAEGDNVRTAQVMARLDDEQLRTQISQAQAGVNALEKQILADETALKVQKQEIPLALTQAQAGVTQAQAQLDRANAAMQKTLRDVERARDLRKDGAVSEDELEQAELALTSSSMLAADAQAGLTQAHTALAWARLDTERIRAREAQLEALHAQKDKAQATLEELRCIVEKQIIRAPAAGTVTTKLVSLGETLVAGAALFDLVDLDRLYVKAYVPEPVIGKIKLGSEVQVFTDAYPQNPVDAKVGYISSRAEFTPKEVQIRDERIKQVFAVKLYLKENPGHNLSPGMPADAIIRWKNDVAWQPPVH